MQDAHKDDDYEVVDSNGVWEGDEVDKRDSNGHHTEQT